jgi:hypothetical protein
MAPGGSGAGSAGGPVVQVSNNQIVINYQGGRTLTEADFREFYKMYERARQQESRNSGLIGPSGGTYRR